MIRCDCELPRPLSIQQEEIEILTPPARMNMAEWAKNNYVLSELTASMPGPWSHEYTPYLSEIMERLSRGPCQVTVRSCSQAGKTELANIFLGYAAECRPAPTLICMPRKLDTERRVNVRIKPMFRSCAALLRHLGGNIDNMNIGKETVFDNMVLYLAWAGSPAALADNPVCYVLLDEVGKYPSRTGKEADPVSLAEKRQRTFRSMSVLLVMSTPTIEGDLIDREYNLGDKRQYWGRCPYCRGYHILSDEHIKIDKNPKGEFYPPDDYRKGNKSRYVCPLCGSIWSEIDRVNACSLENARWVPAGCRLTSEGKLDRLEPFTTHYSYQINAVMLHPVFSTVGDITAQFVRAYTAKQAGDMEPMRDYINSQRGLPFRQIGRVVEASKLREKINDMPAGVVPADCQLLVASADYHENDIGEVRIDYEVRAFGYNWRNYVILAGWADSWEVIEDTILRNTFPWHEKADREELAVVTIFVDSGFHPDKVYDWCRQISQVAWPIKGMPFQKTPLMTSDLEAVLEKARRRSRRGRSGMYRGMQLVTVHTNYFKDMVAGWAEIPKGQPGSTEFYRDIPPEYFEEFASEHKVRKRINGIDRYVWEPKSESAQTHFFDLAVYSAAAAYFNGAHLIGRDETQPFVPAAANKRRQQIILSQLQRQRKRD